MGLRKTIRTHFKTKGGPHNEKYNTEKAGMEEKSYETQGRDQGHGRDERY